MSFCKEELRGKRHFKEWAITHWSFGVWAWASWEVKANWTSFRTLGFYKVWMNMGPDKWVLMRVSKTDRNEC